MRTLTRGFVQEVMGEDGTSGFTVHWVESEGLWDRDHLCSFGWMRAGHRRSDAMTNALRCVREGCSAVEPTATCGCPPVDIITVLPPITSAEHRARFNRVEPVDCFAEWAVVRERIRARDRRIARFQAWRHGLRGLRAELALPEGSASGPDEDGIVWWVMGSNASHQFSLGVHVETRTLVRRVECFALSLGEEGEVEGAEDISVEPISQSEVAGAYWGRG